MKDLPFSEFLKNPNAYLHSSSVDCVILNFSDNQLKVLLNQFHGIQEHMIPGGAILKTESFDEAAARIVIERTGITDIHLQQFYTFSEPGRDLKNRNELAAKIGLDIPEQWLNQRFASTAYYALIDSDKMKLNPKSKFDESEWFPVNDLPDLIYDHAEIIGKTLEAMRFHLLYHPIGLNLLPEKFTIPELQALYEGILGKKLDRRNFSRKINSFDILIPLEEKRIESKRRPPSLFSFDKKKYANYLKNGFNAGW